MKRKIWITGTIALIVASVAVALFAAPFAARMLYKPVLYHVTVSDSGETEAMLVLSDPPKWVLWPKIVRLESSYGELVALWPEASVVHHLNGSQVERLSVEAETLSRVESVGPHQFFTVFFLQE